MTMFSIDDDPEQTSNRIEEYQKKQDIKNNPPPEQYLESYPKHNGWQKTPQEVQDGWHIFTLYQHVPVTLDDVEKVVGTGTEQFVLQVERFEERLFVMPLKVIGKDITMEQAQRVCERGHGARVVDDRHSDVLEAAGWTDLLLFKDLERSVDISHVIEFRLVEVSEYDYFKRLEGKLCDRWVPWHKQELAKKAGGWKRSAKDGKMYPPALKRNEHHDTKTSDTGDVPKIPGELFPHLVHQEGAAKTARETIKADSKAKVKENGHATLVNEAGETLGDNPDDWLEMFDGSLKVEAEAAEGQSGPKAPSKPLAVLESMDKIATMGTEVTLPGKRKRSDPVVEQKQTHQAQETAFQAKRQDAATKNKRARHEGSEAGGKSAASSTKDGSQPSGETTASKSSFLSKIGGWAKGS